jgi:hypothetical protein
MLGTVDDSTARRVERSDFLVQGQSPYLCHAQLVGVYVVDQAKVKCVVSSAKGRTRESAVYPEDIRLNTLLISHDNYRNRSSRDNSQKPASQPCRNIWNI